MNKRFLCAAFMLAAVNAEALDPLTTRWTFGAHEPYSMYRRMGKKSTGGIEGSAKWLRDWLNWWDEKAPETMRELGLNGLHSRFYKGMGWEEEKKDFPNVQKFVRNCHANGVAALAYVQFSTLYFEPLSQEIPNIDDWAQIDEHGAKRLWNNYYFRWMPCITCEEWQSYIERILAIALTEGGFDGIMFDNVFVHPCYCARCERKFAEHLAALPNPETRFGFSSVGGIRQPCPTKKTDSKDPVYQEWIRWRVGIMHGVMARFREKIKSIKPDAVVSANAQPFRAADIAAKFSLEMISFGGNLDLFMMQSDTFPGYDAKTGVVRNRVRDLKIASELGKPIVALCDANAGQYAIDESEYMRPLVEDLIWKGIPTDRTVMSPVRTPGFIDRSRLETRKKKLAELNEIAESSRDLLSAPSYRPVRILYPATALMFSKAAHGGITAAEEILLRNHVPFGYAFAMGADAATIPEDCEVLIVANQEWLSDAQVAAIADYARRGGRVVVTGESGLWDERGAQRFENPLRSALADVSTAVWRDTPDTVGGELGWSYRVEPPKDGGRALMDDIAKTVWRPKVRVEGLPPYVFMEVKKMPKGYAVFLLNYNPSEHVSGAKVFFDSECVAVPSFDLYQIVDCSEGEGFSSRREDALRWFSEHQFGVTPVGRLPDEQIGERSVFFEKSGIKIDITCVLPGNASAEKPVPVFLFGDHMSEHKPPFGNREYPNIPTNTITGRGYAYVRWNFNDVAPNAARYSKDLWRWPVGIIAWEATGDAANTNVARRADSWGTLGAWAWGHSRVMDWIETRRELDASRVAVVGHSRGGKTALWAAAQDSRFAMAVSNGSGCGGARLGRARDPKAETFRQILHNFPNWFCPSFAEWIDRDAEVPHDADDLLRLIAPRCLYVASGSEDAWAGPAAEKAAWDAAHDAWREHGLEANMGYHCHEGPHKLTPFDWERFIDFADARMPSTPTQSRR